MAEPLPTSAAHPACLPARPGVVDSFRLFTLDPKGFAHCWPQQARGCAVAGMREGGSTAQEPRERTLPCPCSHAGGGSARPRPEVDARPASYCQGERCEVMGLYSAHAWVVCGLGGLRALPAGPASSAAIRQQPQPLFAPRRLTQTTQSTPKPSMATLCCATPTTTPLSASCIPAPSRSSTPLPMPRTTCSGSTCHRCGAGAGRAAQSAGQGSRGRAGAADCRSMLHLAGPPAPCPVPAVPCHRCL